MMQLALIGKNIGKSRMARLQMYLGDLTGMAVNYSLLDAQDAPGFSLLQTLNELQTAGYTGVNITQPFKQQAWRLIHADNTPPSLLGAYNTIKFAPLRADWLGTSTDFSGFVGAFKRVNKGRSPGRVLMMGAGGVGRSVAFGLAELGVKELNIFDMDPQQAADLAKDLPHITCRVVTTVEHVDVIATGMDGLVNCTPKGMYYMPDSAFNSAVIGGQQWAFDAVYTPLETEFVKACRLAGIKVISGYDLWIHQGLDAFEIFTGEHVDLNADILRETLSWLD